jgi:NAD(P)H-hydrate epimerase
MAGAVALAAEGALRSGAGYVEISCPEILVPALTQAVPAAILHPLGEEGCIRLGPGFLPKMLASASRCDAVVIGPGIGAYLPDYPWIPNLLQAMQDQHPQLPIILDADGLNHLAASGAGLEICGPSMLLTPHPGEAARLLGLADASHIQADRPAALDALTSNCSATILLKGAGTLIGQHEQETHLNQSGNVGMATAGSGDVLSGHLGALCAMGLSPYDAARLGAYLHGFAGDLFAAEWGQDGLTASDLALWLSKAMSAWRADPHPSC